MSGELASMLLSDPRVDNDGHVLSASHYDRNLKKLVKYLRETNERDLAQAHNGDNLLQVLDPTRNTISYLAVLLALKNLSLRTRQLDPALLNATIVFCASFDSVQARYVGPELRDLLGWLSLHYEQTTDASVIPAIGAAILQLDPSGSTFTSTHLLFLRLCLAATLPSQALPVLEKDIYNFPTNPIKDVDDQELCAPHHTSATFITRSSGLTAEIHPTDVQEYYLLGAHVYIGLRRWSRARLFLELVLASPSTHVATPLMIEAYKKLILLGLLTTGQPFSTKGLVDQQTQRTLSSLLKAYEVLGEIFKNRDLQRFNAELDVGAQLWADVSFAPPVSSIYPSIY